MSNELELRYLINLAGNIVDRTGQYARAFAGMEQRTTQSMTKMERSLSLLGDGVDKLSNRYTALISGTVGAAAIRSTIKMEDRLTRLGIVANRSAAEIGTLKDQIFGIASRKDIAVDANEVLSAVEKIIQKTHDFEFAKNNIENIASAISATGQSGEVIGEMVSTFKDLGIVTRDDVASSMNVLNAQAKIGGQSFADLTTQVSRAAPAYAALGRTGPQAVRELGAAMTMIMKGSSSPEDAGQAFQAMVGAITDKDNRRKLQYGGIQVFDQEALKKGVEVLRPINEIMSEIIEKSEGRRAVLQQIFDTRTMKTMNAMSDEFKRTHSTESMQQLMNVQAKNNSVMEDSARAANTASGGIHVLNNEVEHLSQQKMSGPVETFNQLLQELGPENLSSVIKGVLYLSSALLGLSLTLKTIRGAKSIYDMVQGYRNGGFAGAIKSATGGATPVFVTNMPGSGIAGESTTGINDALGQRNPGYGWKDMKGASMKEIWKMGPKGLLASAGYLGAAYEGGKFVGSGIYKYGLEGNRGGDVIGSGMAKTLAFFGNQDAKDSVERMKRYEQSRDGTLRIHIDSEGRASVKQLESPTGTQLDVGNTTHHY